MQNQDVLPDARKTGHIFQTLRKRNDIQAKLSRPFALCTVVTISCGLNGTGYIQLCHRAGLPSQLQHKRTIEVCCLQADCHCSSVIADRVRGPALMLSLKLLDDVVDNILPALCMLQHAAKL